MKKTNFKRVVLIVLILIVLGINLKGQLTPARNSKSVFITGIAFDSQTKEPLSKANFTINHQSRLATNETGRFSFYGFPNDTVVFTYLGHQPTMLIVPDTLKSQEYVLGVFMKEQSVKLAEIIILRRINSPSIMIKPVQNDQNTLNIAQSNVNKAVVEGLTRAPKNYNADMNVRLTMLTNQIRNEYKGMLVSPENSFGLSTQGYKTYRVIYGLPVVASGKAAKELITSSECETLLQHFEAVQRALLQPESASDTIIKQPK